LVFTIESGGSVYGTNSIKFLRDIRKYKINLILPKKKKKKKKNIFLQKKKKKKNRNIKIGTLSGYVNKYSFEIEDILYSKELNKNFTSCIADYLLIYYKINLINLYNAYVK